MFSLKKIFRKLFFSSVSSSIALVSGKVHIEYSKTQSKNLTYEYSTSKTIASCYSAINIGVINCVPRAMLNPEPIAVFFISVGNNSDTIGPYPP